MVRGAVRLSATMGISTLIIGLTVVSLGTSAPEMAVSVLAGLTGKTELALGNVVGSNICNTFLILGLTAVITPLIVHQALIRLEVPLMIFASLIVLLFSMNGQLSRIECGSLIAILILFTWFQVRFANSRSLPKPEPETKEAVTAAKKTTRGKGIVISVALIVLGLVLLVIGSDLFVEGATGFARMFGVSELIIGLTIVALGTSLPEVATSLVAAIKGENEIAVGNVIGSNLYNLLAVLGLTGSLTHYGIAVPKQALHVDLPIMLVSALMCFPIFAIRYKIGRVSGVFLLLFYACYMAYQGLLTIQSPHTQVFQSAVIFGLFPLSFIWLGYDYYQSRKA